MNEENQNIIEEKPQVKQTTVRYLEEDLSYIVQESKELGIPQHEMFKSFRKAYERLKSTTQGSQQSKLRDVINYTDSIVNLFKSIADSCDELVKQEQDNALAAEQRYDTLVIKHNKYVEEAKKNEKELKKEINSLQDDLKNFRETDRSFDALEVAHSKELATKDKEISELKQKSADYDDAKSTILTLQERIKELETAAVDSVIQKQEDLIALRKELQDELQEKMEKFYEKQAETIDTAKDDLEAKLQSKHEAEIERIRKEYKEEIKRIRDEHKTEIKNIRDEHKQEIKELRESLTESEQQEKTPKAD